MVDDSRFFRQDNEGQGKRIGPYRLLQVLGEGGMGTVYVAEQEEPVRRRVAIKVIRAGMDKSPTSPPTAIARPP